jgi:DNA-binding response OmpR family regulator
MAADGSGTLRWGPYQGPEPQGRSLIQGRVQGKVDVGRVVASRAVDVLLVSPEPESRELMALAVRSIERRLAQELTFRAAKNGELGIRAALRDRPDIVVADEIASRAGAFALARALRDDADPFTGVIVILLERKHDAWLARWSGADAWYVKPVDPFEVADRLLELVSQKEST